jgi:RNA polymerase subunit RPABC4/transcription elongation factor Spt4
MNCPVCRSSSHHAEVSAHLAGFDEEIVGCDVCGSSWSENHGMVEIVTDTQEHSFLAAASESVEGGDYAMVG